MATKNIIYKICSYIPSCLHGRAELQVGEQVKITLQPKNPLWPASLIATTIATEATYGGRIYTFEFDDADLNGGPLFEGCDVISVTPYCCCDELGDHLIAEGGDAGTVIINNFDGTSECVVACPPAGLPDGYVPSIGPDGGIIWGPPSGTTYALAGTDQSFATDIHLNGSDGSVSTVTVPELHDGVPTPGNYTPDVGGTVSIPVIKTDFSTGGLPVNIGSLVIDLSTLVNDLNSLAGQVVTGFAYNAGSNLYEITLQNGTVLSAPGISIDTSIPGQVTITDAQGNTVTLPTQDTTYVLTESALPYETAINLIGNDGSVSTVTVPELHDGVPTPGNYTPDVGGTVSIPVTKTDFSTGGLPVNIGSLVIDLSSLVNGLNSLSGQVVTGFAYDAGSNLYEITLQNGTVLSAPGISIDTSVAGQVTITDAQGNIVTLPTQDTNTTYDLNQGAANPGGDILITLAGSDGSADSVVVPTRYPFIPPATYPLAGTTITLPVLRLSTGGVNVHEGDIILDLSTVTNGYGNGVASFNLVVDPSDPCSEQIQLTTLNGTTFNSGSLGAVNEVIVDPASTQHLVASGETFNGYGLEGENPAANGGIYLPADGGESRGNGPDFVKTISRKTGCSVVSEIVTGRRSANTAVVDSKFYSDSPRYERDDHPFQNLAAIPGAFLGTPQVFRFLGGQGGDVNLPTGQTAAFNFSEVHSLDHVSLVAGIFRTSGCPDFLSFSLDTANFSGRLGDGLETTGNPHYFKTIDSRFHVVMGNVTSHSGFNGYAVDLQSSIGTIEFGTLISYDIVGPLQCSLCDDSRVRGTAVHGAGDIGREAINIDRCSNLSVEVDEINGGRFGIFVSESARVKLSGREVAASNLTEWRGAGVIDVRARNIDFAHDDCTICFDRVVSLRQRPANALTIFNRAKVRAYNTLFVSEYVGSHLDVCVFFANQTTGSPLTMQLSMYNCAARVADLQTPLFQVIAVDIEVYIHGTFKTNAVILTSFGSVTVMTGTIELGMNVA